MSLDFKVLAITPKRLQALLKHPGKIFNFLFPEDGDQPGFEVPQNFDLVSWVLTGLESGVVKPPLGWVVWGGTKVEDPDGETFRCLTAAEVGELATALKGISKSRFDELFDKHVGDEGYYGVPRTDRAAIKGDCYLTFVALRDYYAAAAKRGDAVLKAVY
jgi:hypothetical protein